MLYVLYLVVFAMFTNYSFAENAHWLATKHENYMMCDVSIAVNDSIVKKHLLTTYLPTRGIYQAGDRAYHYSSTVVSSCQSQAFNEEYNKNNFYYNTNSNSFVDICFKINNGTYLDKDGYAEIYLAHRSKINYFQFNYLNRNKPIRITGSSTNSALIQNYYVKVSCKNTILSPYDQMWTDIRNNRLLD